MCVFVCVLLYLYKSEMKSGARFTEQLPGFRLVSTDLRSHLPQSLFTSSFCSHVPLAARETQKGPLIQVRGRTWLNLQSRILANRTARFGQGCFTEWSSSFHLMKWNYCFSASSPCNSASLQLCMNASISQKTQDHLLNMLDSQWVNQLMCF